MSDVETIREDPAAIFKQRVSLAGLFGFALVLGVVEGWPVSSILFSLVLITLYVAHEVRAKVVISPDAVLIVHTFRTRSVNRHRVSSVVQAQQIVGVLNLDDGSIRRLPFSTRSSPERLAAQLSVPLEEPDGAASGDS